MFKRKTVYIILMALFTLLLCGTLALHFTASSTPGTPDASAVPGDFDASAVPEGFDAGAVPGDFDASAMPEGFDAAAMPEGLDEMPYRSAQPGGIVQGIRGAWLPIAIGCILADAACAFMLLRLIRGGSAGHAAQPGEESASAPAPGRKKYSGKRLIKILAAGAGALLIAALALLPRLAGADASSAQVEEKVVEAQAETGSIASTLSGSGTLSDGGVSVTAPEGVKITGYAVENGDYVPEGGAIAYTDAVSVMKTIVDAQSLLDELDDEIYAASSAGSVSAVTAPAAGRVMAIYAESGKSVLETMYESSALALISLDGLMAVDVDAAGLSIGQTLNVTLADGTEEQGMVARIENASAAVTVSDENGRPGERVTVSAADGSSLGSGELYIHSELKVTGFSGTVSAVRASVGSMVSEGSTLMTLTDVSDTAGRASLMARREKLEEQLSQLFRMYKDGCICAGTAGYISGIDETASYNQLASAGTGARLLLLANNPLDMDDSALVNFAAQVTSVNYGSISVKTSSAAVAIADYTDLTAVDLSALTETAEIYPDALTPVYTYENGAWTLGTPASIQKGDTLVSSYSVTETESTLLWIVRSPGSGESTPGGQGGATGGGQTGGVTGGITAGGSGAAGGMSAAGGTEEEPDYTLEDNGICTLAPDDAVSITVSVDELDILLVSTGQKASVTLDALGGQSFEGTVTAVDKTGTNDGGSTKYSITVAIERTEQMLPGMNASVRIAVAENDGVLMVPAAALVDMGTETYVYTAYNKRSDTLGGLTQVSTGVSDGVNVQILSGIEEGSAVYYRYADAISYTFA